MRMSPEKVKDLAAQVVEMLAQHPQIHVQASADALRVEVGSVILDDLKEEDDIDDAVDDLIREHSAEIDEGDMDVEALRQKFRRQIARQRGFIL